MMHRLAAALFWTTSVLACEPLSLIRRVVVFGDEWSDIGNTATIVATNFPPRVTGFYQLTHYSNDLTWQEMLNGFSPRSGVNPWSIATPTAGRDGSISGAGSNPTGTAWAWGGALSGAGSTPVPGSTSQVPNVRNQVAAYLASNPDSIVNSTIYVLQAFTGVTSAEGDLAATNLLDAARSLSAAGASYIGFITPPALSNSVAPAVVGPAYGSALASGLRNRLSTAGLNARTFIVDFYALTQTIASTVAGSGSWSPSFATPGNNNPSISDVSTIAEPDPAAAANRFWWGATSGTRAAHQVLAGLFTQEVLRIVTCPVNVNGSFGFMRSPAVWSTIGGRRGADKPLVNGELWMTSADIRDNTQSALTGFTLMTLTLRQRFTREWFGYVATMRVFAGTQLLSDTVIGKTVGYTTHGFDMVNTAWIDDRATRIDFEVREQCFETFRAGLGDGPLLGGRRQSNFNNPDRCNRIVSTGSLPDNTAIDQENRTVSSKKGLLGLLGLLGLIPLALCCICLFCIINKMRSKKAPPAEGTIASTYESDFTDPEPIPEANVHYHPIVPAYPHGHVEHVEVPYGHHHPTAVLPPGSIALPPGVAVTPGFNPTQTIVLPSYPQSVAYGLPPQH